MKDNHRDKFKLITLGFVAFVTSFGAHVVAVNLPVYAKQVGAGLAVIGLLIAVYDFAESIAKPVFGYLADHKGMKVTMLAGIAVFALAFLIVDPRLLLLIKLLQGLGAAGSFKELGDMLGPLLIGLLAQAFGIKIGFVVCGALGLATLGLLKAVRQRQSTPPRQPLRS